MLKDESIYAFRKFEENPPIFMKLSWSFFIMFIVQPIFIFQIYPFQIAPVVSEDPLLKNLELIVYVITLLGCCLGFNIIMMYGFCGNASLSGCCGK
jgi:hypothetical protein